MVLTFRWRFIRAHFSGDSWIRTGASLLVVADYRIAGFHLFSSQALSSLTRF
jgi:hypothetical protein